jgi:maltooligosyltrehalose trehalohydrolase
MSAAALRVWAPVADEVVVEAARPGEEPKAHPMVRRDGGWWEWLPASKEPLDYAFRLDGGDPRPDPRSAWQPHGVHGPSRTFDPAVHEWRDSAWAGTRSGRGVLGGVVYELHVGTFTEAGTLDAAGERLSHLVELGADVVEVMPLAAFGGTHGWGYDGVQPYAVQHAYGGPAAFQRFVDSCHAVGLGVCLDVVYNHLGPTGNYLADFGPYFSDQHDTPWGRAINLDGPGSDEVRRWILDNALRWFRDFHVDALRLDAVHALHDGSSRHLLAQLSDEAASLARHLGRPLDLLAESDLNDPVMVIPTTQGGLGMTAQWDDDVHHALHVALTGERNGYYADFAGGTEAWPDGGPLSVLAKTLTGVFLHDRRMSTFRGRVWGRPVDPTTVSGHRFLAYLQTHDQVGNRATGDRIGDTITPGRQAIGAALYLLSPYTAMVFMGEEWRASTPFRVFSSFEEEGLAEAVRTGRRREFAAHGWAASEVPDPQDPGTREASVLRWDELRRPESAAIFAFYRRLVELRRTEPDLASGDLTRTECHFDEDARWFVMSRGPVHVVVNLGERSQPIPVSHPPVKVLAAWGAAPRTSPSGILLDPDTVAVVRTPAADRGRVARSAP